METHCLVSESYIDDVRRMNHPAAGAAAAAAADTVTVQLPFSAQVRSSPKDKTIKIHHSITHAQPTNKQQQAC
jgi:hypothetical protein